MIRYALNQILSLFNIYSRLQIKFNKYNFHINCDPVNLIVHTTTKLVVNLKLETCSRNKLSIHWLENFNRFYWLESSTAWDKTIEIKHENVNRNSSSQSFYFHLFSSTWVAKNVNLQAKNTLVQAMKFHSILVPDPTVRTIKGPDQSSFLGVPN